MFNKEVLNLKQATNILTFPPTAPGGPRNMTQATSHIRSANIIQQAKDASFIQSVVNPFGRQCIYAVLRPSMKYLGQTPTCATDSDSGSISRATRRRRFDKPEWAGFMPGTVGSIIKIHYLNRTTNSAECVRRIRTLHQIRQRGGCKGRKTSNKLGRANGKIVPTCSTSSSSTPGKVNMEPEK